MKEGAFKTRRRCKAMQMMNSRGFGTVFDRSGSVTQREREGRREAGGSPAIRCKETERPTSCCSLIDVDRAISSRR